MSKPVIAVDIDEVLVPLSGAFLDYHNRNHDTDLSLKDMRTYYVEELTRETAEQMLIKIEAFVNSEAYKRSRPLQHSVEAISRLSGRYTLALVTARDHFYRGSTEAFIEKYFPGKFRELHYTHSLEDVTTHYPKYVVCQQLNAVGLIDDSLHNVQACAEHGIPSVLFGDYPWNQTDKMPDGVVRCKDWTAVEEYFDGRTS